MTKGLYNWSYRDVTDFLKENGFSYSEGLDSSHEAWIKFDEHGPDRIVEVNFSNRSYPPKTLKKMIRQSGIAQEIWIEWARCRNR